MPKETKEKRNRRVGVGETEGLVRGSSMVKFLVGKGEEAFFIHENIIRARSEHLIKSMQGSRQKEIKIVKLPEEDAGTFDLYVDLVYTSEIPYMIKEGKKKNWVCRLDVDRGCHDTCIDEYSALCRLYAFAEKILDTKAQIATITALAEKIEDSIDPAMCTVSKLCFPPVESINIMYNNTHSYSIGRRFLADTYARHSDRIMNPLPEADLVPAMFLWDVAEAATQFRQYQNGYDERDLECYHWKIEHDDGECDLDEESHNEESDDDQNTEDTAAS